MASEGTVPQPKAILRGHKAQVHAASFIRNNSRLVTGDADGFVVCWDLTIMRPRAVWQAHTNAILGIAGWQTDKVITHGRDHKLIVWKLAEADEANLSALSPLDPSNESRPQPWMLHLLEVNTMNFCAFSACSPRNIDASPQSELLVAVPNTLKSEAIDIFHLPSQHRKHTVNFDDKNGMAMALSLLYQGSGLIVVAGFENGMTIVAQVDDLGNVTMRYRAQPHSQPILSLDVAPGKEYFLTSSADAIIAKHPIPAASVVHHKPSPTSLVKTQMEQSLPAHSSSGQEENPKPVSLLSAALANEKQTQVPEIKKPSGQQLEVETTPLKIINTKHSGQQGLRIRSDSRIFATAGWDSRVRVYSAKTMKEVAVLKWHQVGCFAVAFSDIQDDNKEPSATANTVENNSATTSLISRLVDLSVKEKRIRHAETAHWLAAGSKDGKVSLWDVF